MQSLVRVCVNVGKKLVVLYIFYPEGTLTEGGGNPNSNCKETTAAAATACDMKDVNMLPLVEVDEIRVSRWMPGESEG
jgi:hypothetical protein